MRISHWHVVGEVEITEPGRYEVLTLNGRAVGIRPTAEAPDPDQRAVTDDDQITHLCYPCTCCGRCACASEGTYCGPCAKFQEYADEMSPRVAAFKAALASPEPFFAQHSSRLAHAITCQTQLAGFQSAQDGLAQGCDHSWSLPQRCPIPVRENELKPGGRCGICCPDVVVAPTKDMRFGSPDRAELDRARDA